MRIFLHLCISLDQEEFSSVQTFSTNFESTANSSDNKTTSKIYEITSTHEETATFESVTQLVKSTPASNSSEFASFQQTSSFIDTNFKEEIIQEDADENETDESSEKDDNLGLL